MLCSLLGAISSCEPVIIPSERKHCPVTANVLISVCHSALWLLFSYCHWHNTYKKEAQLAQWSTVLTDSLWCLKIRTVWMQIYYFQKHHPPESLENRMQLLLFDLNRSQLMLMIGKFESVSWFEWKSSLIFYLHVYMIAIKHFCLCNPLLYSMTLCNWKIWPLLQQMIKYECSQITAKSWTLYYLCL